MASRALPLVLPLLLLLAVGAPSLCAAPADDAWKATEEAVAKSLASKEPAKRAQAFLPLRASADVRAIGLLVRSIRTVATMLAAVTKQQMTAQQSYEVAINLQQDLDAQFETKNDNSPRATEAYNKQEKKISVQRNAALEALRNLENEYVRTEGLLDTAVQATAQVLKNQIGTDALPLALAELEKTWLRSPNPDDGERFLDAIEGVDCPPALDRVRAAAADTTLSARVRGVAVGVLATRGDGTLPDAILPYLTLGPPHFALVSATIGALAKVHRKDGVLPLIEFLGRQDIGRLRTDAWEALMSLTGLTHGPYKDPWADWWKQSGEAFVLPEKPVPTAGPGEGGKGVTFFGIHTFSERILFVMDVSGSMDKPDKPGKPESRIAVAKRELLGGIFNVDDGFRFNVVLFNHEVMPWQPGMVVADRAKREQAKGWIEARNPIGATNISDALESAFHVALAVTGEPAVDTVFFYTDGTPTAGRFQDPARILEAVREWNRSAHLVIHCVGVGEADHAFLRELALIGKGKFVQR